MEELSLYIKVKVIRDKNILALKSEEDDDSINMLLKVQITRREHKNENKKDRLESEHEKLSNYSNPGNQQEGNAYDPSLMMLTNRDKIEPDTDRKIGLLSSLQKVHPMSNSGDEFDNPSDDSMQS